MLDFLRIMTPFLLASMGGLYTELSGTTNVAIEGYTTLGAFLVIMLAKVTGSLETAIILTIVIIGTVGFIHSFTTIKLRANPVITGLAVNMGFFGIISVLSFKLYKTKGFLDLNLENKIETWALTIIALVFPVVTYFIIMKTRYGMRLMANGINKRVLNYSNISTNFYNISSMVISSIFSSLAGIFLALELRGFVPNISSGRGWISLVIIFLGRKNPLGIVIGCTVFTATQIISNRSQASLIPSEIVLAIPYFLTLLALIITNIKDNRN